MSLAPVIVFAYNRPGLLAQTLQSLSENELAVEIRLYVFCDGPKNNAKPEDIENIQKVREIAKGIRWAGELHIEEAGRNKGLAASVISGVTEVVDKFGKVIVVEDDVLLSPYFLRFMNEALDKYEKEESVLSIGSWNYFAGMNKLSENFFIRYPDSIAWATYARSWKLFEPDAVSLLRNLEDKNLMDKFNCGLSSRYFENMLENQRDGKIDSWAIRWTAVSVLHSKMNFYPRLSMSKHVGFGSAATHESLTPDYNSSLRLSDEALTINEIKIEESAEAIKMWKRFVKKEFISKKSLLRRIINKLKRSF